MAVTEITAKSLLRIKKKTDSWFLSRYHLNLYRGCLHNCIYCDGRAEKYAVEGRFGEDVTVKINAPELLRKELDPARRRKLLRRGFVCFGGGVGDAYQSVEKVFELARNALSVLQELGWPVHILTKSTLVQRDIDFLEKINSKTRTLVSFSFSSVDEKLSAVLEPGVPSPHKRLEALRFFKSRGIAAGMFFMPVVPFVSDSAEMIEKAVRAAAECGLDWVIFGGMTLKKGKQAEYFLAQLDSQLPGLRPRFDDLYKEANEYGGAPGKYYGTLDARFYKACKEYRMPVRIPRALFADLIGRDDVALVLLEHIDYLLRLRGEKSGFGYAAWQLSKSGESLPALLESDNFIPGVNARARTIAREILETGTASLYERLIRSWEPDDNNKRGV